MPTRSSELARPHRPAGAVLHPRVEILDAHARLVEHAHAVVEERDQDPVDDETRRVVAADRVLAEPLAERVRGLEGLVAGALGADDLDERHQRRRVEEVHADDALRRRRSPPRSPSPRAPRCSSRARRPAADALQLGEQLALRLELLDDRLDHEVAAGEAGELGREREVGRGRVARVLRQLPLLDLAREEVRDPVARALSASSAVTSRPTVSTPASTHSCAMPAPIAPRPTTPTFTGRSLPRQTRPEQRDRRAGDDEAGPQAPAARRAVAGPPPRRRAYERRSLDEALHQVVLASSARC